VVPTITTADGYYSAKYDAENDGWKAQFIKTNEDTVAINGNVQVPFGNQALGFAETIDGDRLSVNGNMTITGVLNGGTIACGGDVTSAGNVSANGINNAQDFNRPWLPDGILVASNVVQSSDQAFQPFYHNGLSQACTEYSVAINKAEANYNLDVYGYTGTYSLHMTGGYVSSESFWGVHVVRTSAATTPAVNTRLTTQYNSALINTGIWNSATGYITAPLAGFYQFSASVTASTANAAITVRKNATTVSNGTVVAGASSTTASGTTTSVNALVQMNVGDTLSVWTGAVSMTVGLNNTMACYLVMASSLVV
jgi:hypothetical protein